jgi:hypothetical protein
VPPAEFYVGQTIAQIDEHGVAHVVVVRSVGPDGKPDEIAEVRKS